MRFAPIFKYRMRDCLISVGVVMLVMVVMTVLSCFGIVTFGGYEQSVDGVVTESFATMNFTMPYVIFMFVVGIVTIREDMRIGIQNGAGRTTSFLANLACLAATALLLNLNCLVFYKLWALLDTDLIIIDLYSMAFLQEMTPDTLGEMLMCFITGTAASLALAGCGVMLSLVYWRLGKAGKWILSLGMGAAFILFINASASYDWLRLDKGFALGIQENREYHARKLRLRKGDRLFCYTDGVTEAVNSKGEIFGEKRLLAVMNRAACKQTHLRGDLKRVMDSVREFAGDTEQSDDVTMLILEIKE